MTTTMGVKLERQTKERLEALGKAKDRTPHWLVKKEIAEDRARLAEFDQTGESYSLEEVRGWMAEARAGKKARWPR